MADPVTTSTATGAVNIPVFESLEQAVSDLSSSATLPGRFSALEPILGWSPWEGATAFSLLIAFLLVLLALVARKSLQHLLTNYLMRWAKKTKTDLDAKLLEAIKPPLSWIVLLIGFRLAGFALHLPEDGAALDLEDLYFKAVDASIILCIAWLLTRSTKVVEGVLHRLAARTDSTLDDQLVPLLGRSLNIVFVIVGVVMAIQRLGYEVGPLIAGLGIGGLAFALAAQDTLKNFFGSVVIFTDRPYQVGDWILACSEEGTVEEIGFRSTRIRTFANTLITVPNSKMADASVENVSRWWKRRIKTTVGVTYATSATEMEAAIEGVRTILHEHKGIDQDLVLVYFTNFGDSSLDIMIYCFTKTTAWAEWLQVRQEVYLAIMRMLADLGLSMAFPSHSLYLENVDATSLASIQAATPVPGETPGFPKEAVAPELSKADRAASRQRGVDAARKALRKTLSGPELTDDEAKALGSANEGE